MKEFVKPEIYILNFSEEILTNSPNPNDPDTDINIKQ